MTRLVSGIALAALTIAAILLLPNIGLRLVVLAVAIVATTEYVRIVSPGAAARDVGTLVALVAAVCWATARPGGAGAIPLLGLVGFAWVAFEVLFAGRTLHEATTRAFGALYIGLPLGMLVAVHALAGREAVLLLILTVVISDSAQYYTGRMFGRHALAPAISPKKTIEGALGGLVFGTAFAAVAGPEVFPFVGRAPLVLLGLAVVALGICGDLFESRLKRASNLKDSSTLIPGHGGVLDRIDALLFATPAFYVFLHEVM